MTGQDVKTFPSAKQFSQQFQLVCQDQAEGSGNRIRTGLQETKCGTPQIYLKPCNSVGVKRNRYGHFSQSKIYELDRQWKK